MNPFGGTAPIGRGGRSASARPFYLHQLLEADATQWGNGQDTLTDFSMEHNGPQFILKNLGTATVNSMEAGVVGFSWPIGKVLDLLGRPLTSPTNLNTHAPTLSILERSPTSTGLPNSCFGFWGFCEGADPSDSVGQGIGLGLAWESTTLRRTVAGARRTDTTWTLVKGATGTSTCMGARLPINPFSVSGAIDCRVGPLDSTWAPISGTTNIALVSNANHLVSLPTHVFVAVGPTAQGPGTPTIRFDGGLKYLALPWA